MRTLTLVFVATNALEFYGLFCLHKFTFKTTSSRKVELKLCFVWLTHQLSDDFIKIYTNNVYNNSFVSEIWQAHFSIAVYFVELSEIWFVSVCMRKDYACLI